MGTISGDESPVSSVSTSAVRRFFSSRSWIEGSAEEQLLQLTHLHGVESVAAFPDLHPGKFGPVGVSVKSSLIRPSLIGNDIGCGMSLFLLSLKERKLNIDRAARQLRLLGDDDVLSGEERLVEAGLPPASAPFSLGTVGGGNHFCELLAVDALFDEDQLISKGDLLLLVHSGSRSLGESVFSGLSHEHQMMIDPQSVTAHSYLSSHDLCVKWAALNRQIIAERAADLLGSDLSLVADVPHNIITCEENSFVHRKGAAVARPGDLIPIAGSRGSLSFLVRALPGVNGAHGAVSHGSGRKYDRAAMHGRLGKTRSEREALARNKWGGQAICEDRNLLIEEAPFAYKSAEVVVEELQTFGLVEPLASLHPLITFKRAYLEEDQPKERWTRGSKEGRR